jgi:hypothetical protein
MNNETTTVIMTETAEITLEDVMTEAVETEATSETTLVGGADAPLGNLIKDADPSRFVSSAKYMGIGMLGIFLVMGILIIGTAILNKVTKPKSKE